MRMSTKGRFAVNALIDLALREADGPVALASIGARQGVSLSYLEQLFSRLRRDGVVESTRGPGGGYMLARPADQVSVADIVSAVDDPIETECIDAPTSAVVSKHLWLHLHEVMLGHMATISLQSLVDGQIAGGVQVEPRERRSSLAPAATVTRLPRPSAPNSVFAFGLSFAR